MSRVLGVGVHDMVVEECRGRTASHGVSKLRFSRMRVWCCLGELVSSKQVHLQVQSGWVSKETYC